MQMNMPMNGGGNNAYGPQPGYYAPQPPTSYYPGSTKEAVAAVNDYQQRYQQLYPQYQQPPMYQPMQSPQPQQQNQVLKGRPVSSIEEAKAAQIEYDGSLFLFYDISTGNIYGRRLGIDGKPSFETYIPVPETPAQPHETQNDVPMQVPMTAPDYITKKDLDEAMNGLRANLENTLLELVATIDGGVKNEHARNEPTGNDAKPAVPAGKKHV